MIHLKETDPNDASGAGVPQPITPDRSQKSAQTGCLTSTLFGPTPPGVSAQTGPATARPIFPDRRSPNKVRVQCSATWFGPLFRPTPPGVSAQTACLSSSVFGPTFGGQGGGLMEHHLRRSPSPVRAVNRQSCSLEGSKLLIANDPSI